MAVADILNLPTSQSIQTWIVYRAQKLTSMVPNRADDPFVPLLRQLTGVSDKPPKRLQVEQHWSKHDNNFEKKVKDIFESEWEASGKSQKQMAAFRANVTRRIYSELPAKERAQHKLIADADHEAKVKAWKEEADAPLGQNVNQAV